MQTLGVNTIRVYNVDPTLNHDMCVSIFNAVGIYILLDVNSPLAGQSIDSADPASSYDSSYLSHIFSVVEAFKDYPNLLGFFAGNEVMNDETTITAVPPYLRAVTRDLKNYIAQNANRSIPVGYSAADVRPILANTFEYLTCAINGSKDDMTKVDMFGLNSYSWCGSSATFESSTYSQLIQILGNTTVPVFFSEYGCNKVAPRVFDEVQAIYGPDMDTVMSGGLVYEYSEEPDDFGLVKLHGNGTAQLLTDFDNLQRQYNKLDISELESANSTATGLAPPTCKSSLITGSTFDSKFQIPSIPSGGQGLIDNGISNPNNGKLVSVTKDIVQMPVYSTNGDALKNLAIKPLANDQSNTPNGQNTSGAESSSSSVGSSTGSATATGSAATPSASKGTAGRMEVSIGGLGAMMALLAWYI